MGIVTTLLRSAGPYTTFSLSNKNNNKKVVGTGIIDKGSEKYCSVVFKGMYSVFNLKNKRLYEKSFLQNDGNLIWAYSNLASTMLVHISVNPFGGSAKGIGQERRRVDHSIFEFEVFGSSKSAGRTPAGAGLNAGPPLHTFIFLYFLFCLAGF